MTRRLATRRRGYTLVELLVVMAMIALILGIALPSIFGLLNAGAEAQAYNKLSSMLTMARALAVQNGTYAGVHVQMVDNLADHSDLAGTCYAAVMIYKNVALADQTPVMRFVLAPGYAPTPMPGGMAFGEVSGYFVLPDYNSDGSDDYAALQTNTNAAGALLEDFGSFTIVFSPTGSVVRQVEGQNVQFLYRYSDDPNLRPEFQQTRTLFFDDSSNAPRARDGRAIWSINIANDWDTGGTNAVARNRKGDGGDGEPGATALTLFRYAEVYGAGTPALRAGLLNRTGQFLPMNIYTGQLFRRQ